MAISATIYKADINIADMDRHYYQSHEFTIAQHPSETELRMMIRLCAFILNAHEQLSFTKGLSSDDEPDLWQKSLTDEIELWIDLGQPEEKRIRKACGRAKQVIIYTYNKRSANIWWQQQAPKLARFKNLKVIHLDADNIENLVQKSMSLQANIQDTELYLSNDENNISVIQTPWSLS
ncbi:MAG TPA: YaeQ family protein [Leucothrix mucor]|nr:YaeQ family protein [Leucothrix mucor]